MNKQKQVLENTFKQTFDMGRFVEFSTEFFNGVEIVAPNKIKDDKWNWSEFSVFIDGYFHVANYVDPEKNKIAILAVKLKKDKSVEKARSMQRNFVAKLLSVGNLNGAIVAFYSSEDTKWRLSFVKLEMEYLKGKVGKKITPAKRYSYLVGEKEPCHTAMNRLLPIFENEQFNPTLAQIEEAFSVEVVTKAFFEQYKQKYIELKEYLEQNECFIRQGEKHGFTAEQFAKKLMGQLAFLYFLQKKGWMGVKAIKETLTEKQYKDAFFLNAITRSVVPKIYIKVADDKYQRQIAPLNALDEKEEFALACGVAKCADAWGTGSRTYMRDIFDYSTKIKCNYFDDILEPLFYEALNKKREASDYYCKLHCRIPFLNGGLFEPFGDDWGNNDFDIPNEMFSERPAKDFETANGILDIFDRYNFTINEDEPLEREVAVDPEMLGKIFENLLDVKDRKSKGAFYTPREIVHYMCQESLINYLVNEVGAPYEDIKQFILYGEILKDEDTSRESKNGVSVRQLPESVYNKLHEIDKALENVKVADPAVGSGAFPMGMVSEICKARNNITSYMSLKLKNSYDKRVLFNETRNPYLIKKETLLNCIFAVDIEPSAIDITKLRLWLSLVVEQDIDDLNKNPYPLPNLDCNIMCGNSLIDEFEGRKLFDENILTGETSTNFADMALRTETEKLFNKMFEAQRELFYANDHLKKEELKNTIKKYIDIMVGMQLKDASQKVRDDYEIAKNMASTPFFLWKLQFAKVFKEKGGFDIVIGNPPYLSTKGINDDDKALLKRVFGFADDLYYHFIVKGFSLLSNSGSITMITPDTYFTTQTKLNLRKLLLSKCIDSIIHLGHNVFDSAMVSTAVFVARNTHCIKDNAVLFIDAKGSKNILNSPKYLIEQSKYGASVNKAIFIPTKNNIILNKMFGEKHNYLIDLYWDKISTSRDISNNFIFLNKYRTTLKTGDLTLLGLVTEGGQGLATANNGKFVGVINGTKEAKRTISQRKEKFLEFAIAQKLTISFPESELEIRALFDDLKEKYGRDIFGQGFLYRIIDEKEIADVESLSFEEKKDGIKDPVKNYVPYDKGDKDGNRWYLETPYGICWNEENVSFLKANSGKKGQGMPVVRNPQFYFKEGFCYSDIKTFYLRCRLKGKSIHDVKSMSFFPLMPEIPAYYLISIINSKLMATLVYNFINNTPSFQINDCRMLPIIIPSLKQLGDIKIYFDKAVAIKKSMFNKRSSKENADLELEKIQEFIDLLVYELYGLTEEEIAIVEGKNE